jgi:Helitron helicase-like domain at N-terminus
MRWVLFNQKTIRADQYRGLADAIDIGNIEYSGKVFILPASITGSPRYMHKRCLDALTLYAKFGKPHLFITGTTNPKWTEITNALLPGQIVHDRPDIAN